MTPKTIISSLFLTLAMAPAAFADASDFQGLYAGFSVGAVNPDIPFAPADPGVAPGYAIFGGYNHAFDANWVAGGELSFGMSGDHDVTPGVTVAQEKALTVSARGGYVFDKTMIYGRLGYQTSDVRVNAFPVDWSADGFVYGIGVEHKFSQNMSARFEYTHADLDLSGAGVPAGTSYDTDTFSAGVAFHF